MGGEPLIALNVVCFPTSCEPISVLQEILDGGARKVIEAKAMLAGGHSVQDEEPKYGLVVFGEVDAKAMWTVGTAREGDCLLLTKPVGTGIAVTAIKAGLFAPENIKAAEDNMAKLNAVPPLFTKELREKVHACTDLTGFGLGSHALDLASPHTSLEIDCAKVPLLPGIEEMANMGLLPAGSYENKKYVGGRVINQSPLGRFAEDIVFDPQTSGGLLIAAPREACEEMLPILRANGFERSEIIGRFVAGDEKLYLKERLRALRDNRKVRRGRREALPEVKNRKHEKSGPCRKTRFYIAFITACVCRLRTLPQPRELPPSGLRSSRRERRPC